jgi:hypothetical protein
MAPAAPSASLQTEQNAKAVCIEIGIVSAVLVVHSSLPFVSKTAYVFIHSMPSSGSRFGIDSSHCDIIYLSCRE